MPSKSKHFRVFRAPIKVSGAARHCRSYRLYDDSVSEDRLMTFVCKLLSEEDKNKFDFNSMVSIQGDWRFKPCSWYVDEEKHAYFLDVIRVGRPEPDDPEPFALIWHGKIIRVYLNRYSAKGEIFGFFRVGITKFFIFQKTIRIFYFPMGYTMCLSRGSRHMGPDIQRLGELRSVVDNVGIKASFPLTSIRRTIKSLSERLTKPFTNRREKE